MRTQAEPRVRKRMPCELDVGSGRYSGIVLNVSRGGLYVQSNVSPPVGAEIAVDLSPPTGDGSIPLNARVVWKRVIHRRLTGVTQGGVGLQIQRDSGSYRELVAELMKEQAEGQAYRVRLTFRGGPRSRTIEVRAESEEDARALALERAGEGWSVLGLDDSGS